METQVTWVTKEAEATSSLLTTVVTTEIKILAIATIGDDKTAYNDKQVIFR